MPEGPDSPAAAGDWVVVGEIVGVFGVRGEVKVRPLSDFAERFAVGATLYLGDDHIPHTITKSRLRPGSHVLGLSGIETANDAERLRGRTLAVPADALATLAQDQFFQHDVVGMRVEHVNGASLGVITEILSMGPYDTYVVRDAQGAEHMLPAVKAFIKQVDLAAGVMRVEPIPGLFDENADEAR
jgi:16S rRNA processing protein RimM